MPRTATSRNNAAQRIDATAARVCRVYFGSALSMRAVVDVPAHQQTGFIKAAPRSDVPPASFHLDSQTVVLHPYLIEKNAPRYVLEFLMIYGGCMFISGDLGREPELIKTYNYREKAMGWLAHKGFPRL